VTTRANRLNQGENHNVLDLTERELEHAVIWAGRRSDKKFAAEKEERATAPSSLAKTPASVDLEAIAKLVG
jgi:hypothetical protein